MFCVSIFGFLTILVFANGVAFSQNRQLTNRSNALDLVELSKSKPSCCGGKADAAEFSPMNAPEYETYKLSATYYSLRDNLTTTLMLNNKGAEILATPTLYSLAGTRLQLAPITVPATSYMDVDMHQLLNGAPDEFLEGSMKISYTGGSLQLGAQVRMIDPVNKLIWAEQFVYTSKFKSNRLENVWWLPYENSETRVVVSNTSSGTITATITVDGTSPQQSSPIQLTLLPWETRVLDIMSDIAGHQNGHVHDKGGISITHTGSPGAVLARMFISKPNKGYSAAVNFTDPESTVSQKWTGGGLRFKNLNGDDLDPVLVARNNGAQTSQVNARIIYTDPNGAVQTLTVPQFTVSAGSTERVDLDDFVNDLPSSVTYGGIEIDYDTPKGTIITTVQTVSDDGDHVFQVPMMDPENMPASAGGFPWKADGDFHTLVYIKNETDATRKYVAYLTYEGGQYSFGDHMIKPRETVAIDFRKIRDEQTPDINGTKIPLNVNAGQIAWSARGIETRVMSGRSEQISNSGGVASTYACYACCTMAYYDSWITPYGATISVGGFASFVAWQRDHSCNDQVFPAYTVDASWVSWDTTVAGASGGYAYGYSPGSTIIQASWYTNETVGYEVCESYSQLVSANAYVTVPSPTVQVNEVGFTGDHQLTLWPSATPPLNVIDDPDGTAPTWKSSGSPDHPVAYSKGATATMFAKLGVNPGSPPNMNVKIRVKNGSTVVATKDIVQDGNEVTITGISTNLTEAGVKKTTPTFAWEISYNSGSSWSSIGNSGPHTMYWTYAEPLSPSFKNDAGTTYSPLYDEALKRACDYSFGESTPSDIIWNINEGVELDIPYNPNQSIYNLHPLKAYSTVNGCQCSDQTNLLRGLLRSIGIDGTTTYIWAGPNASTVRRYTRSSGNPTDYYSFQIDRSQHDYAEDDPHFLFHAVVSTNGTWYDPSYGMSYSSLNFIETAFNNTPQQVSTSTWGFTSTSTYVCSH